MLKKLLILLTAFIIFYPKLGLAVSVSENCEYKGGDWIIDSECYVTDGDLYVYGDIYIKNKGELHLGSLGGFKYRKQINLTSDTTLTDFQVKITIDTASLISAGKMQPDCDDIRFTDSDGVTLLPYWLESGCNSTNTVIWVKVPEIPASSTKTIYMYYGNPNAESKSNAKEVFVLFEDFEDYELGDLCGQGGYSCRGQGSLVVTTESGYGKIVERTVGIQTAMTIFAYKQIEGAEAPLRLDWKYKIVNQKNDEVVKVGFFNGRFNSYDDPLDVQSSEVDDLGNKFCVKSGSNKATSDFTPSEGVYYSVTLKWGTSTTKGYIDGTSASVSTVYPSRTYFYFGCYELHAGTPASTIRFYYFRARKDYPQPSISIGPEEEVDSMPASIWFTEWEYRKPITITEQSGNNLENYQVFINVTYDSDMQSDFDDLRFTWLNESSGEEILIPYWIEKKVDSSYAEVWVKVPEIPASSTTTIYMYYGNPNAESKSNATETFVDFDDFSTNTLDEYTQIDSGWYIDNGILKIGNTDQGFISKSMTLNRNYALRARVYMAGSDLGVGFIWGTEGGSESSVSGYIANYYSTGTYSKLRKYVSGSFTNLASLPGIGNGWYTIEVRINNTIKVIRNGNEEASSSNTDITTLEGIGFRQKKDNSDAVDWWALRKYVEPEPSVSIGSEQVLGQDFHRYIYIYTGGSLYVYRHSAINEEYILPCTTDADCNPYDCLYDCVVKCDVGSGNLYYYCDDYGCIDNSCQVTGESSLKCDLYQACDCGGETSPSYFSKDTVYDYSPCISADQTSCPLEGSYTDTCIDSVNLKEYYCSGGSVTYETKNCNDFDCEYNCGDIHCSGGDLYATCDDYGCSDGACAPTGGTVDCLYEDCQDTCEGETSPSPFTDDCVTDYEPCSPGDTSCPSHLYCDGCSGDTLYETYCSGSDHTTDTIDCNDYNECHCADDETKECTDYTCSGGKCVVDSTTQEDCANYYDSSECVACVHWYCCYCSEGSCTCTCRSTIKGMCWAAPDDCPA